MKKGRILFVEDDKVDQTAFERFADKDDFPYDYTMANSVEEATNVLKSEKFDAVVMDHLLGDGTAFDLFKKTNNSPIIILTSSDNAEVAVQAMKLGACDYLIKNPDESHFKTLPITVQNAIHLKKTEDELSRYQTHLEKLVEERTRELEQEIDVRKNTEKALLDSDHELRIRNRISDIFLTTPDEDMYSEVLQAVLQTMQSKFGIFGYIDRDGNLACPSMTKDVWEECQMSEKTIIFPKEQRRGLWGQALNEKKTFFQNTPFEVPQGHITITKAMAVPIIHHGGLIGLLHIANKDSDYEEKDRVLLETIADHIAPVLYARMERDRQDQVRKIAEHAQRQSEVRYRSLLENINLGIVLVDTDHNIVFINSAQSKMLQKSADEIIGKKCYREFEKRQNICPHCPGIPAMDNKLPHEVETEGILDDGTHIPVSIRAFPTFDNTGKVTGFIEFVEDMTLRRAAEKEKEQLQSQLIQSQKMESIGRLAGGVAHDFNNILSAINGYAELSLMKMGEDDPLRTYIETISSAGKKAAELTQQLLAFSHKQIIKPKILDLNTVIAKIQNMLGRIIGEDIRMRITPGQGLWKTKADPTQIEQVIINLAVNGSDAMPTGGELHIETDNLIVGKTFAAKHPDAIPGKYVMLAITDTGHGMSEDIKNHVFEPFFTTKGKGRGTGMGLSTVYGIVKQNNGFIDVYSHPEKGASFKIYLPYATGTAENEQTKLLDKIPRGTETILVAEDEDEVRGIVVAVLSGLGYKILEASDGKKAANLSKKYDKDIQLLLTDVVMPNMNGNELSKKIKKSRPGIEVIFMSGYTEDAIVDHGILKDGVNFLHKPLTPQVLARVVRDILDSNKKNIILENS